MFEMSEKERKTFDEWNEKHKCNLVVNPLSQGAIGGRLSFCFTPTSLGVITKVKCACGESVDVTDFSDW